LFALLVCFTLGAQNLVTIDRVGPLPAIAKQLTADTGVPIEVAPNVTGHTLIVDIRDKPLSEVLKQLAWTTFTRVVPKDKGFRIEPDPKARKDAETIYHQRLVAWYKADVAQLATEYLGIDLDTPGALNLIDKRSQERAGVVESEREMSANLRSKEHLEPGARAAVSILASIPAESLLSDRPGYRTYALYPGGVELPVSGMDVILNRYLEERKLVAGVEGDPNKIPKLTQALFGLPLLCGPNLWDAILHGFDEKGDLCEQADVLPWEPKPFAEPWKDLLASIPAHTPVTLSQTSQSLLRAWDNLDSASLAKQLADPVKNDPQATLMADVWRTFARETHRDLVLDLPDQWITRIPTQTRILPSLADAIKALWPLRSAAEGSWLVGGPPIEQPGWEWQVPRPEIARLLRELSDPNLDRLEIAANFLQRVRLDRLPLEYTTYLELAGFGEARPVFDTDPTFLAFYMSLNPETRQRWRNGGTLQVSPNGPRAELLRAWAVNQGVERVDGQKLSLLQRRGCETVQALPRQAALAAAVSGQAKLQAKYLNRGRMVQMSEVIPAFNYYLDVKKRPAGLILRPVNSQETVFSALLPGGWLVKAKVNYGLVATGPFTPFEKLPAEIMQVIRNAPKDPGE